MDTTPPIGNVINRETEYALRFPDGEVAMICSTLDTARVNLAAVMIAAIEYPEYNDAEIVTRDRATFVATSAWEYPETTPLSVWYSGTAAA